MKRVVTMVLACLVLAACGGPVRRVWPPAASIQQLTVHADGGWSVDVRIDNFSSVPMRFDKVSMSLAIAGEAAGMLQGEPTLTIGPEAADVATLRLVPSTGARIAVADALASKRTVAYTLKGSVDAAGGDSTRARNYPIDRSSALSPVPGLDGVLR